MCPRKGNESMKGLEQGATEGSGIVQSEEEKVQRRPDHSTSLSKEAVMRLGVDLLFQVTVIG